MSDWKCWRFFYDAFENGIESLDARYKGRCQEISFDFVCSPSDMQWKDPELRVTLPENLASQQQNAKHLSARAVVAYRAGFPVALLSVTSSSERPSGIVCDWKGQRDSFHNDEKLLGRAFAFVYVGSIVDQAISDPISDELRKELVSDMSS